METKSEWPISQVAKAAGISSRTLRYYEHIGLLLPSRIADNGYRFYGEKELTQLHTILSIRTLGLPLISIKAVLNKELTLAETIQSHLSLLEEEQRRTAKQISACEHALTTITEGGTMNINELFADIDQRQYENEVRQRWGDDAWEQSIQRRSLMSVDEREQDDKRSVDINNALRNAAESEISPTSQTFQTLIAKHYQWVTDYWGGKKPNHDSYLGLANLYVADPRFSRIYGGQLNAKTIRAAIQHWVSGNLS